MSSFGRKARILEVTAYLDSKVRQAKWVIAAVDQRKETMLRCMQAIMTLQPEYFRHAQGALRPMTLADVAAKLGVHESTVSRTIQGQVHSMSRRRRSARLFLLPASISKQHHRRCRIR